jgi:hypothetical protein
MTTATKRSEPCEKDVVQMLNVTERAKAKLKELLESESDDRSVGLRLGKTPSGALASFRPGTSRQPGGRARRGGGLPSTVNPKGTIQKKDGKQVVELVPVRLEVNSLT